MTEDLDGFEAERELSKLRRSLEKERGLHKVTKRERDRALDRVDELETLADRFATITPANTTVPKWTSRRKKSKAGNHATPLLMLSDLHLDEVVDLRQMAGLNSYDRATAETRLERIVEQCVALTAQHISGYTYDGIVVVLNGDILTGDIHEELARTNEAPTPVSITHWVPRLASALVYLADAYGKVFVPCCDGNHDRTYKKLPAKQRHESSFAWIIYNWLAELLASDERITFSITPAESQVFPIYDTWFHQTHGDAFRSLGGVGGIHPAMNRYTAKMEAMWAQQGIRIDCHLFGHWHQYLPLERVIVNGSLKGYDEYAKKNGFNFEPPRQAFALVTPERGIAMQMPIYAE